MKENIAPKLILAIAVFAAIGFAMWTGLAMDVEAPATATPQAAFTTPF